MPEKRILTRRELLRCASFVAASAAFSLESLAEPVQRKEKPLDRPNILFAIADDWSWPHAGVYGDQVVKTPAFDRVAKEGVLFSNAFCAAPTCTASRGAILTGQAAHRLEDGANLWSTLPKRFQVYPDLLEEAGYFVGHAGKGWGPGNVEAGGRTRNPAGPRFANFAEFLKQKPADKPFCFWFGSLKPHRPYEKGSGLKAGMKTDDVNVPPFWPDTPEVRSDILDYYKEVMDYDAEVAELLETLDKAGLVENTLVVVTSDNGMPFPRAKCNMYDAGTHMPLAIRWPARVKPGWKTEEFINAVDFAPTFLEAAGLKPLPEMTGRSFLDLLTTGISGGRDRAFCERERHTDRREGRKSYPMRAVRTKEFLYIRNLRPDLWPAGDPQHDAPEPIYGGGFSDIDSSPTKSAILERRDDPKFKRFFELACAKRPEEELYDLKKDPWQIENVADNPDYADAKRRMRAMLDEWMESTADPRAKGETDFWDKCPYRK